MEPITAVSQVGFPIVVSILLFRQYKTEREHRREERKTWQESLDKQTQVLRELRKDVRQLDE